MTTIRATREALQGPIWQEPNTRFRSRSGQCRQRFGKYVLGNLMGRGGSADVYHSFQRDLGREIALKIFPSGRRDMIKRARQEARILAHLRHPNIVSVLETGVHEGRAYFTMQIVPGMVLDAWNLSTEEAVRSVRDVALTLEYVHRQGFVHLDIKPENILRNRDGKITLIDFGNALRWENLRSGPASDYIRGTPAYVAPEQLTGKTVGPQADLYSLASTLYQLLAKCAPFPGKRISETLRLVRDTPPNPLIIARPDLPEGLTRTIERGMKKRPANRQTSTAQFAEELDRYLDRRVISRMRR